MNRQQRILVIILVAVLTTLSLTPSSSKAQQGLPVLAVSDIESSLNWDTGNLRVAIESALASTRKFRIMERARLATLLKERGLSVSGITDGKASLGGFEGLDYILYARLMRLDMEYVSGIFKKQCVGEVELNVTVSDVHTGEIRFSDILKISQPMSSISTLLQSNDQPDNPCDPAYLSKGDLESVAHAAGATAAHNIALGVFPIKVIRVSGMQYYLNYGEGVLSIGDYLRIVGRGDSFVDPDTGEVLGSDEVEKGFLVAKDVREKFSISEIVPTSSTTKIESGDIAYVLDEEQTKGLKKVIERINRDNQKRASECQKARKNEERHCKNNQNSSKCKQARSAFEQWCAEN